MFLSLLSWKKKKEFDEKIQAVVNSEKQNIRGVCTADKGSDICLLLTESLDKAVIVEYVEMGWLPFSKELYTKI